MSSLLEKKKSTTTQEGVTARMYLSHHQTTSKPFASCVGTVPTKPPIRRSYASPPQILVTAILGNKESLRNECTTVIRDNMSR